MKSYKKDILISLLLWMNITIVQADFSGSITAQGRAFFQKSSNDESREFYSTFLIEPEYYKGFKDDKFSFTFRPFAILDTYDPERRYIDIRELNFIAVGSWWEGKVGISREFWSVTEFTHLVNVINQTDFAVNINEEEKLGQPMAQLTLISPYGTLDLFGLFGFRERTYPGPRGRFQFQVPINTDDSTYESSREEKHIDYAIRYSHSIGIFDIAASFFQGTGREPELHLSDDDSWLIPFYDQMTQTGIELQAPVGDTLFKLEGIYRNPKNSKDYFAFDIGLEHTFVGVFGSTIDLGVLVEYVFDDRNQQATSPFANDLFIGMRIAANDTSDTQLLAGFGQDLDHRSQVISLEASRRLTNHLKISIEAQFFISHKDDNLSIWETEDFIQIDLSYYF